MHTWCASVHSFLIPHSSSPCQICQELPKVKAILAIFSWSPPGSSNIHGPHIVGGQNAFSLEALLPGWGQIGCMARRPGVKKAAHSAKSWRIRPWKQGPEMVVKWSSSSERHTQTEVANTCVYIYVKYMKILIYTYLLIYTVHMLAADSSLALRIFIVMLLSLGCCWHKATSYCRNLWTYIQLASYSTGSSIGTRPPHNAASVARVTTNDGCTAGASDAPGTIFTFLRSERSETEIKYPVQV